MLVGVDLDVPVAEALFSTISTLEWNCEDSPAVETHSMARQEHCCLVSLGLLGCTECSGYLKAPSEVHGLTEWARVVGSDARIGHGDEVGEGVVVDGPFSRIPRENLSRDFDGNGVYGAGRRGRIVEAAGDTMANEAMSHGRGGGEDGSHGQEKESKGLHTYSGD